jgi:hypothetical protein
MVELGWAGITVPEDFGGLGFGYMGLGVVMEECGRTLTASPLFGTGVLGTSAILHGGTQEQKTELLKNVSLLESALKNYSKEKIEISIIDSVGEWEQVSDDLKDISIIKLYNNSLIKRLPKGGFIKSRFTQLFIFMFSFFKIMRILKKDKPDFIIAHLIISLPLIIMGFLKNKTKLIIRISGLPRLNFVRKLYWSYFSKNVYKRQ